MEPEVFYSEWFRVTHLTRKRSIHEQLMEIAYVDTRLDLTPIERATLMGRELLQHRLWRIRRGE